MRMSQMWKVWKTTSNIKLRFVGTMMRPLALDLQIMFTQAFKLHLTTIASPVVCRECQRHFSSHRHVQRIQHVWSKTVKAWERKLSSVSKESPPVGDAVKTKMAASASAGTQQKSTASQSPVPPFITPEAPVSLPLPTPDAKAQKVLKVTPRPRKRSLDYSYTGNIYILPIRAMNEYLLKPSHLEKCPVYPRRSPYEYGPKITMYLRSDVEDIAKMCWGSLENLAKEKQRLLDQEKFYEGRYDIFQLRAIIDQHKHRVRLRQTEFSTGDDDSSATTQESFWASGSSKVVVSAILINGLNSLIKGLAWTYTGSHSMFSEFIHSIADTLNQIILGIGLYHSMQKPDSHHPYGYMNLRHISSLISGVGIFCLGTGLSVYHGIQGFIHPEPLGSLTWAIATLMGSLVSEGATLIIAVNQVRKCSRAKKIRFWEYVVRGNDPNVSVVLLEDMAAVTGVIIAATCLGVSHYTRSPFADSLGSIMIGGLLGVVATFIITTNTQALVGRSIPEDVQNLISHDLERDRMIRSLHDVKATEMGGQVRFKAEVDFDGKEITRAYLYKLDMEQLLAEMHELKKAEDVEAFMLLHGERIIDMLGEEVDRIEKILKGKYPELRHVDLEAL
ncbi:zinc transporter 9-like [Gigantopelta aegis]|uniref:zinc transporter 9-like n=1 Tax=Gigantopelta aegis TaxID=1735272 RepID=UPI001B88D22B|nr:zinc transporter 9-like [Gigantopelta aegis]